MRASYVQVFDPESGRHVLVRREDYVPVREQAYLIMPDLPDYLSPIDNRLVSGRAQRREDLKRNNCRPYEKGEKADWLRNRRDKDQRLERDIHQTLREIING